MSIALKSLLRGQHERASVHLQGEPAHALKLEQHWRWPTVLALACTVPAFYVEILQATPPWFARAAYLLAATALALAQMHLWWTHRHQALRRMAVGTLDLALVAGLLTAALLPASSASSPALALRMVVALLTLLRICWALRHLLTRGGLVYLLAAATGLLGLCGLGFWWLEPRAVTLADGLWLAFTTAATVGYGDIVPSTPASKIFSVFVVMLGFGVLSLVTAAIATAWIETEERIIEREILRDLHRQMALLNQELGALRADVASLKRSDPP